MPYECLNCSSAFNNGVSSILSGCPVCNQLKFLYVKTAITPSKKWLDNEDRVENIRQLNKGSYEIDLDSLLKDEEIVMAIKEAGTYMINLPSLFKKKKK